MSVYAILCHLADEHTKLIGGGYTDFLTFDFEKGNIKSKKKYIVKNGELAIDEISLEDGRKISLKEKELITEEEKNQDIQTLYDNYICSRPSWIDAKSHFTPKTSDELSFEQLLNGEKRSVERCRLEAFVILGNYQWPNEEHWFFKGNNGMVLYRNWFKKED